MRKIIAFLMMVSVIGGGSAAFGQVIEGMDVVDTIAKTQTTAKAGHKDVPAEPIVIEKVRRKE